MVFFRVGLGHQTYGNHARKGHDHHEVGNHHVGANQTCEKMGRSLSAFLEVRAPAVPNMAGMEDQKMQDLWDD